MKRVFVVTGALMMPFAVWAQQAPDHTAQAAYATANDLMTALIATRAGVLDSERKLTECRAELAKAKEPAPAK